MPAIPPAAAIRPSSNTFCDAGGAVHDWVGGEISQALLANLSPSSPQTVTIKTQATPLTTAQFSVYIYEDNAPTNGQDDLNETGRAASTLS